MESARPLRDVFADLTGGGAARDPEALLRDQGHPGLPEHLVAEAVVSYAETAPVEVAEHLAPYVTAHSAVGAGEVTGDEPPAGWLDLLGTAPAGTGLADQPADLDDLAASPDGLDEAAGLGPDSALGLDFGTGAEPAIPAGADDDLAADGGGADLGAGEAVEILADPGDLDAGGDLAGWAAADSATEAELGPEELGPEELGPDELGPEEPAPDGEPLG